MDQLALNFYHPKKRAAPFIFHLDLNSVFFEHQYHNL